MRALLFRRTVFIAILATGLALTASAVHGLSGMDRSLELAAVQQEPPSFVNDERGPDCDFGRDPARRV